MRKLLVAVVAVAAAGGAGWWVWQHRAWDGKSRFTVINLSSPVTVESFDPETGAGVKLVIPDNLEVDTVGGRGAWQAVVLGKAGRQWGMKWAADSLADYLGISYTGVAGSLGGWDEFWWRWWGRSGQWHVVKLTDTALVAQTRDPDGAVLERLTQQWPEKAGEWFSSVNLAREVINVSIVNSTDVEGLGAHAATVIGNSGLRVVAVENSQNEVGQCVLTGSGAAKKSLTGVWLTEVFGCGWRENNDVGNDVTLVLGSEYKKWWTGD